MSIFYEIFKDDKMIIDEDGVKELGREYFILSLYLLLRHLAKYYVLSKYQYEIFKEFVIHMHERWREKKDEELILGAQKILFTERVFDFDELEDMSEED